MTRYDQPSGPPSPQAPQLIILSIAGLHLRLDVAALAPTGRARLIADCAPFLLPPAPHSPPPSGSLGPDSAPDFAADSAAGSTADSALRLTTDSAPASGPGFAAGLDADLDADLDLELAVAEGPPFLAPAPSHTWRIATTQAGGRLHYTSYHEQGWLDLATGRGRLLLRPGAQPENFLRVAFAHLALVHGGLLLHASGLIRPAPALGRGPARGYAFFGHSGAGKSTVASLAPPGSTLLSDDLVLLRLHRGPDRAPDRVPDLSGGLSPRPQVWLYGVPFGGAALSAPRPNAAAPLAGLYALRQAPAHAPAHALVPLPRPLAAAQLLACTPFLDGDAAACRQALRVCMAIAAAIPIHTLAFARNPGFWPLLTGEEARSDDDHA